MSEHTTEHEQDGEQEYRVNVWATPEFTPRVTADSEAEAETEAEAAVKADHMVDDRAIKTVRARHAEDDTWYGEVWATKEYPVTVTASSPEDAKEEAKEEVKALHPVVDSDIESIEVEA